MLGVTLNDVDIGVYTARLNPNFTIRAAQNEVIIHYHRYARLNLTDFLGALTQQVETKHFPRSHALRGNAALLRCGTTHGVTCRDCVLSQRMGTRKH